MAYRKALRITQAQKDAEKQAKVDAARGRGPLQNLSYRELQKLAADAGISPRQSADALREQLK